MKKNGKLVVFIGVALIFVLTYLAFFGVSNSYGDITTTYVKGSDAIRWGIDIRGGVEVTFTPPENVDATPEQIQAAEAVIKLRLLNQNITDSEVYTDYNKGRIIVRFPWKEDETNFDPSAAIDELGATALLTFREGTSADGAIVIEGKDVVSATPAVNPDNGQYIISLELSSEGATKFAEGTGKMIGGQISIWMDDTLISAPGVEEKITDGKAMITGNFDLESVQDLANKINAGALPFALQTTDYSTISPTLGSGAKDAMLLAGLIAFILVCIYMIVLYRVPGLFAAIGLLGQVAGAIAAVTGFFPGIPSFTLTLPGMAGIILSVGMGVDCNIIVAERIKEELKLGKSLESSIKSAYNKALTAVIDGNITIIIVSIILMGSFGNPGSLFAKILSPLYFMFSPTTSGTIYSFGYTLLMGVIFNFIMSVGLTQVMVKGSAKFKFLRKSWLYGGKKDVQ